MAHPMASITRNDHGGTIGRRLIDIVMLVVLLAGGAKALDLPAFHASIRAWEMVPPWARLPLTVTIPSVEITIALAWFTGIRRRGVLGAVAPLFLLVTAAFTMQLLAYGQAECNCFGKLLARRRTSEWAWTTVVRNSVMLAALGAGAWLSRNSHPQRSVELPMESTPLSRGRPSRAFTLIEVLVILAIVAVLLALSIGALAGIRESARSTAALAQIRQHGVALQSYSGDYAGFYPYFTEPSPTEHTRLMCGDDEVRAMYFHARFYWYCLIARLQYENNASHPSFRPPGFRYAAMPYNYSMSFLAEPAYWSEWTRIGPVQWRGISADRVVYPTMKGVLVSWANAYVDEGWLDFRKPDLRLEVAFCDGSGARTRQAEFRRPIPDGDGPFGGGSARLGRPVVHTRDGVRGRDVDSR
jgi:hypothetical protein